MHWILNDKCIKSQMLSWMMWNLQVFLGGLVGRKKICLKYNLVKSSAIFARTFCTDRRTFCTGQRSFSSSVIFQARELPTSSAKVLDSGTLGNSGSAKKSWTKNGISRGVILYIIHYFTLMSQKCTLFTLFLIFVHYTLFLSNMYIISLIIHYFSNFFVKRVVQDPRRGQ